MVVPVMIIAHHPFLDTFRRNIDRDMDLSVLVGDFIIIIAVKQRSSDLKGKIGQILLA